MDGCSSIVVIDLAHEDERPYRRIKTEYCMANVNLVGVFSE